MTTTPTTERAVVAPAAAVSVPEDAWQAALAALTGPGSVLLACHVSPDGDALGSMLALAHALDRLGVDVACTWGDERWARPPAYSWLPGIERTVPPEQAPESPDVLVVLDTGARDRLGVLAPRLRTAGTVLVLDHHAHGADIDPAVHCVDPTAAATAVVVEELVRRLGVPLDETIATCLYVGVVTDTGSFAHSVTTPAVHGVAARLLAAGVRPDVVARRIFGTRPVGVVHLLAYALSRVHFDPDLIGGRGLIWTAVPAEVFAEHGLGVDDADAAMEVIRATGEADVAVVVKQDVDGAWKVSSRSRGASDVGAACAALGGGGHRLAAGFTATGALAGAGPADIVAAFVGALTRAAPP
jgi:phosphoesterase RecJ-like protein